MKTAFNILPERTENEQLHLLVEAGNYGISFIWFTKDPHTIKGISVYDFTGNNSCGEIADIIGKILQSDSLLTALNASVTVCYDFKESLLVPEVYYKPATARAMLELVYADDTDCTYKTEAVRSLPVYNVYSFNKKTEEILTGYFPQASFHHATSLQLARVPAQGIYCIFFHNNMKVFLFKESTLQLVQQFQYNTPVDVTYHLLTSCYQHNIKPSEVNLLLSGMIDGHSKLYTEICRYFLNIEFENTETGIELNDRIKFYPAHFFSHLIRLTSCVS